MPDDCHIEKCPIGINLDSKVETLSRRISEMEVCMGRIDERLITILDRVRTKAYIYPIVLALTTSAITGLVVYFISNVQN